MYLILSHCILLYLYPPILSIYLSISSNISYSLSPHRVIELFLFFLLPSHSSSSSSSSLTDQLIDRTCISSSLTYISGVWAALAFVFLHFPLPLFDHNAPLFHFHCAPPVILVINQSITLFEAHHSGDRKIFKSRTASHPWWSERASEEDKRRKVT